MFGYLLDKFSRNKFMGVNMNRWAYIGVSSAKYVNKDGSDAMKAEIFFFCLRKNTKVRKFVVSRSKSSIENDIMQDHPYIKTECPLWVLGEYPLEDMINNIPSSWIKDYMAKSNYRWDIDKKNWVKNINTETVDNVVKINFPPVKKGIDTEANK